jgi:two-component system phosphate regulon sensor histidine kinase PhoR
MKFLIFSLGVIAAGAAAAALVWSPQTGLVVFGSMLAGLLLGLLFSTKREESGRGSHSIEPDVPEQQGQRMAAVHARTPALLEAMMDGMREGMLVVDEALRIVAMNRAAREMFGQAGGGVAKKHRLSDLTRHPAIHSAFDVSLGSNEQAGTKVEMQGPGGPIFDLRVVPLRLDEAQSRGAMGVFFNITRLERLERVRQEFLSNVSHELRTPLTAIIAFVETLEDGAMEDQESNRRFLHIIRKNAERMHNLIDDILELSAIEAGTVELKIEQVELRPLVSDVLTALDSRAEARRVTLSNEVPAGVTVRADARRLEQMLTNLTDNAIKFNREAGSVTVGHERGAARHRITVRDSGDGIPPEHVARIFERFYRVDRARSREMGGTGLGLAIVKHLARAHNGDVRVQSAAGQGSTFVIELPSAEVEGAEDSHADAQAGMHRGQS